MPRVELISIQEAMDRVRQWTDQLPAEHVPLDDALGRVLACDVHSDIDSPPYRKSLVDGYAVRLHEGSAPRSWRLIDRLVAGQYPEKSLSPGEAIQVMTGSVLPEGTDAVAMVEHAREIDGREVQLTKPITRGVNLMEQGSVFQRGQRVLECGRSINAARIGLLAEVGCASPQVYARPSVATIQTGDELVAADTMPGDGQIRNSNGPMLRGCIGQAEAMPRDLGVARDELSRLSAMVNQGLEADVLVLSGGVSAGVKDYIPQVMEDAGVTMVFHKISLRPGKPLWFGVREQDVDRQGVQGNRKTLVFGLPGNPISALVCFLLFVRPAIRVMSGHAAAWMSHDCEARLEQAHTLGGNRPTYWPATLVSQEADMPIVRPLPWRGSADQVSFAQADCLIYYQDGGGTYDKHAKVAVKLL